MANSFRDHLERKQLLKENVLDPINKTKSKEVWTKSEKLLPEVKTFVLKQFFTWWEKFGYSKNQFKKMVILGSITGFQYDDASDIDINVIVDLPKEEISKIYKLLPGNVKWNKHPVNYYLTTDDADIKKADGSYDVEAEKWIKNPKKEELGIDNTLVLEVAKFFMDGIDGRVAEYERDVKELEMYKAYLKNNDLEINKTDLEQKIARKEMEIKADIESIKVGYHLIKSFRNEPFRTERGPFTVEITSYNNTKSSNSTINNLVYKILEKFGYFEKVHKIVGDYNGS